MLLLKDKTVLFAEDDSITRHQMGDVLKMIFHRVHTAEDGEEAYRLYEDEAPHVIITDIKMPKRDGLSLVKQIRQNDYDTPIIILTSFAEQELLLHAANLSIDGYLVKPVDLDKLTRTICKAIQRTDKDMGLIPLGKRLYYNSATRELYLNGTVISLGVKEQDLLALLIENRHKTVTKEEIGKALWPLDPICDSAIKNIVLRVRKKLELDIIISVRGIGYRLDTRETLRT